jgi:hypothetical protein
VVDAGFHCTDPQVLPVLFSAIRIAEFEEAAGCEWLYG